MNINEIINDIIINDDEIVAIAGGFYREGGFDEIPLGEMIFSAAMIANRI